MGLRRLFCLAFVYSHAPVSKQDAWGIMAIPRIIMFGVACSWLGVGEFIGKVIGKISIWGFKFIFVILLLLLVVVKGWSGIF